MPAYALFCLSCEASKSVTPASTACSSLQTSKLNIHENILVLLLFREKIVYDKLI